MEHPANPRTNRVAVWALAASLLGLALLVPIVGSVIGIVWGRRAVTSIEATGERGGGVAQAAVVFGWFGIVEVSIGLVFLAIILVSAVTSSSS